MTALTIFIIRAVLAAGFAVLLTRFFYPRASIAGVVGIAVVLVGLAYVTENFRKRRQSRRKEP